MLLQVPPELQKDTQQQMKEALAKLQELYMGQTAAEEAEADAAEEAEADAAAGAATAGRAGTSQQQTAVLAESVCDNKVWAKVLGCKQASKQAEVVLQLSRRDFSVTVYMQKDVSV
jgi:hypothetical protein